MLKAESYGLFMLSNQSHLDSAKVLVSSSSTASHLISVHYMQLECLLWETCTIISSLDIKLGSVHSWSKQLSLAHHDFSTRTKEIAVWLFSSAPCVREPFPIQYVKSAPKQCFSQKDQSWQMKWRIVQSGLRDKHHFILSKYDIFLMVAFQMNFSPVIPEFLQKGPQLK